MVLLNAPAAVMVTLALDFPWTNPPNCALMPDTVSAMDTAEIVGTTEEGTVMVKFLLTAEPIFVLPEYVVTVTFAVPLVALGIAFSQEVGMA